ncbi:carboxymuconolactone decarboxylase family protein [Roseimaritima sediminicola]|uniref:carboxymuconolactone decarboxylase family protein n=1 Tax=Roseimaritima sediminicola TaxID=2662066 RepID=UPI0012982834|nr:peroxidase-related enzyme [Roseimaritima sediminicola]
MSRIHPISPENAQGKSAELFAAVKSKLGMVPNMMRAIGNSPAVLGAYLQFSGGLASGTLSNQQRELIALTVGEANRCDYCLAAHSALGQMAGLDADQIRDARHGSAVDAKSDALIRFARKLVDERGHVSGDDLQELRGHGFTEGEIAEVVANVALNLFTNYFNHVADPDIDFPKADPLACRVA